jgi:dTMP kinase
LVVGAQGPDLTLILDLPVEAGLARAASRGEGEDRYEKMGLAFHERLRAAFLEIARQNPQRCVVIDATFDIDTVEAAIWTAVSKRFSLSS